MSIHCSLQCRSEDAKHHRSTTSCYGFAFRSFLVFCLDPDPNYVLMVRKLIRSWTADGDVQLRGDPQHAQGIIFSIQSGNVLDFLAEECDC